MFEDDVVVQEAVLRGLAAKCRKLGLDLLKEAEGKPAEEEQT